jgi:membrane protease YdiL (CAAX protease family)
MQQRSAWRVAVAFELALGWVAWAAGRWTGIEPAAGMGEGRWVVDLLAGLVATLPLLLFYTWAGRTAWPPLARLQQQVRGILRDWLLPATQGQLALVALAAGVGEELLFRGLLQAGLEPRAGPWGAWLLASTLFAALHALSLTYFLLALLMGMYLGGLWMATGSVVAPVVAHALYDWWALRDMAGREK